MCNENYKKEHENKLEIAILKNSGSALQFYKNQQWRICHYTLLVYGAIIGIEQFFAQDNNIVKGVLIILNILVAIYSIRLNLRFRDSIIEHRKYVNNIYKNKEEQTKLYGIPINQQTREDLIDTIFIGSAVIGCVITFFILIT